MWELFIRIPLCLLLSVSFAIGLVCNWSLLQLAALQSVSFAVSIFLQRVSLAIGIFCRRHLCQLVIYSHRCVRVAKQIASLCVCDVGASYCENLLF